MLIAFISGPYRSSTETGRQQNIENARRIAQKYANKQYTIICLHTMLDGVDIPCQKRRQIAFDLLDMSDVLVQMKNWLTSKGSIDEWKRFLATPYKEVIEDDTTF